MPSVTRTGSRTNVGIKHLREPPSFGVCGGRTCTADRYNETLRRVLVTTVAMKTTMHSLCIVDLHVVVSNIKMFTVSMDMQEWFLFARLSSYKIFRTAVNNTNVKCLIFLSDFNQI